MRPPRVAIVGAAGFLLAAAGMRAAAAQEPEDPQTTQEGEDLAAATVSRQPRWGLSVRVQEARDTNPSLQSGEPRGSWVTSLRGGAFRSFQGRRSRHLLSAGADVERYHQLRGLDHVWWSGAASSELRLSPRSRLDLEGSVISTRARDLQTFLDTGLLLPATPVRRLAGSAEFSHSLSPVATISAWGRHQRVAFDSEELADGFEWALGATLGRRFGPRHTASLSYGFRRSESGEEDDSFHAASASWSGSLSPRVTAEASLGGVYRAGGETDRPFEIEGGAGLAYRIKAVGFAMHYARSVGQAFGFSVPHLSDVGVVRFDWTAVKDVVLAASSSYGWSRDPVGRSFDFRSRTHSAEVRWSLTPLLALSSGYAYLRRVPPDESLASTDHVWKTSLSVGRSWP